MCVAMCCEHRRQYRAQFDFTPTSEPLVLDEVHYLRDKCFHCVFNELIVPELAKHGIHPVS